MYELPPELLSDIFLLALPYPIHPLKYSEYHQSVIVPLRISHVCRAWRELSLSYGELWSYLCIDCFESSSIVKVFDTWLERTNGVPLNFYLTAHGADSLRDDAHHRNAERIITTMISQQHRWKEVKLSWANIRLSPEFPGLNLTNLPMLESLILYAGPPFRTNINIARSSRLRRLVLQATNMDLEIGEQSLYPLTEHGDIYFFDMSGDRPGSEDLHTWLNFLKATPNLKEFCACSDRLSSPPTFRPRRHPEPFITLPNIQTIKLGGRGASYILDYVTLPGLRHLLYGAGTDGVETNKKGHMLVSFFGRSLPPLTSLVIQWYFGTEDFIIPLLTLLPTLKYLRIGGATVSRRLFDRLTVTTIGSTNNYMGPDSGGGFEDRHVSIDADFDIGSVVCPGLETLFLEELKLGTDSRSPCLAFIAMVKSRARALRKFRNIYLIDRFARREPAHPVVTRVSLSAIDEDIGEFRLKLTHFLVERAVAVGNYEAVDPLLTRGAF